jgi:hypothetical protein
VNGSPAMIVWAGGEVFAVYIPVIDPAVDGGKIIAMYTVAAPDKLAVASRQARVSQNAGLSGQ